MAIVTDPATEYIDTEEELRAAIQDQSVLINCRTGRANQSKPWVKHVLLRRIQAAQRLPLKVLSWFLSPRRTINAQNAQLRSG